MKRVPDQRKQIKGKTATETRDKQAPTHLFPAFAVGPVPIRSSWIFTPLPVLMNLCATRTQARFFAGCRHYRLMVCDTEGISVMDISPTTACETCCNAMLGVACLGAASSSTDARPGDVQSPPWPLGGGRAAAVSGVSVGSSAAAETAASTTRRLC